MVAIAGNEARKKEHTQENPVIRDMQYIAKLGIYVAIYEATNHHENGR